MLLAARDFYSPLLTRCSGSVKRCVLKLPLMPCFCLPAFGELGLVGEEETRWSSGVAWSGEARQRPSACADGARSGSPMGKARLRLAWAECGCGSCSYTGGGTQPVPPHPGGCRLPALGTCCLCFPRSPALRCAGEGPLPEDPSNTRLAGRFARTKLVSRCLSQ